MSSNKQHFALIPLTSGRSPYVNSIAAKCCYPATYVSVPVWCCLIRETPNVDHPPLRGLIVLIEQSRVRVEPELAEIVGPEILAAYRDALLTLLPLLPGQMARHSESTREGVQRVRTLLALQAFALGQVWTGMLLGHSINLLDQLRDEPSPELVHAFKLLGLDSLGGIFNSDWPLPQASSEIWEPGTF